MSIIFTVIVISMTSLSQENNKYAEMTERLAVGVQLHTSLSP